MVPLLPSTKPLLVLYGKDSPELAQVHSIRSNVTAIQVRMSHSYASHHSKGMLLFYKDKSMRVVVSTANLYEEDWKNRTQGIWISPRCYEIAKKDHWYEGESESGFRSDLLEYLNNYCEPELKEWTARIKRTNFEAVK